MAFKSYRGTSDANMKGKIHIIIHQESSTYVKPESSFMCPSSLPPSCYSTQRGVNTTSVELFGSMLDRQVNQRENFSSTSLQS